MISYDGLIKKLDDKGLNKSDLVEMAGVSSRTVAKIGRGEKIANHVLEKIAAFLNCEAQDLWLYISDNPLLRTLQEEKSIKLSGGLYHELQVRMTYNSNHIEGSKLSEEQTRLIFETNTIDCGDGVPVDDIIETVNHFRAIDYIIDVAEEPLSENIIKNIHKILKQGTKDSTLSWFAVGEYKKRPNVVGGRDTAAPKDVASKVQSLLAEYNGLKSVVFNDIVEFHYKFEGIHPFQDGNGRVGRLIAFKECLKNNIVPFIIEDSKKMFYYRGLSQWENDRAFLIDTCLDGQDTFRALMSAFGFEE